MDDLKTQLLIIKIFFIAGIAVSFIIAVIFIINNNFHEEGIKCIISVLAGLGLGSIHVVFKKTWAITETIVYFFIDFLTIFWKDHETISVIKWILLIFGQLYIFAFAFCLISPFVTIYRYFSIKKEIKEN